MITYEEALRRIHSLDTFGSRPGLDRIKRLLELMGNPQDSLKFVHVAGTNGKGSTCTFLSAVLTEAGYKTGLFISPYITDFRERIQINGKMISQEILADAVDKTYPLLMNLRDQDCIITEFEYVMALEFFIHKNAGCDVVVLETGLGGLLDCTNVILPPLCSVITAIGLDHTAILGNTIEEIAEQKCGIIKENSPVVTSPQDGRAMMIIEEKCVKTRSKLTKSEDFKLKNIRETIDGTSFDYKGQSYNIPLIGKHQIENARTALAAIEVLQNTMNIPDSCIVEGFAKAVNPARFEVLSKEPLVILDGAHNPNGIEALKKAIDTHINGKKPICIMGMLGDKDSESSIKLLEGIFSSVYTVPVSNPRALNPQILAEKCQLHFEKVQAFDSPFAAFDKALNLAEQERRPIVICGSLYLAGEIRPYIIEKFK